MAAPTYVLVHGAFGGAWAWRDVGAELDRRSLVWTALDLPSSHDATGAATLADDADALVAVASGLGPTVVVGHSYGGAVVAEAAGRLPQAESLVFVAAIVPLPGESASVVAKRAPEPTVLDQAMIVQGPLVHLNPDLAAEALYGHCDADTREWALGQLGSQSLASFRSTRSHPDSAVPRRYVVCSDDRAVHPVLQDSLARRCDEWMTLDTDHSPMFSQCRLLVDVLSVSDTGI
jgi:pimeloyl-ACP methyl ester carboxylesterase